MQITIQAISSSENKKSASFQCSIHPSHFCHRRPSPVIFSFFFHMTPMGDIWWARLPQQGQRRRETLAGGGVSDMMTWWSDIISAESVTWLGWETETWTWHLIMRSKQWFQSFWNWKSLFWLETFFELLAVFRDFEHQQVQTFFFCRWNHKSQQRLFETSQLHPELTQGQ